MSHQSQEIETKKVNIHKLFTDYWFRIPEYQRSYVWGEEEFDELLDDLSHAQKTNSEKEYFFGSIVLQKYKRSNESLTYYCFDVLDGQQRLTTLFLMLAVLRDIATNTKLKGNAAGAIYQEEDPFSNQPERIRLEFLIRDQVGQFVDEVIKEDGGTDHTGRLKEYAELHNVSLSHMAEAVLYLRGRLKALSEKELNQFAIFLLNKVIVIYVASESLDDAFRLFTILNDRGIPLSHSDILKSINVGEVRDEKKRRQFAQMWERFESEFGRDDFDRFLGHIRTILIKDKARENLLQEFEKIYKEGLLVKGEETLKLLDKYRQHYGKLIWFEEEELGSDCRLHNLIMIMNAGLSTDWIPPLLFFYDKFRYQFDGGELLTFLQRLESKFSADRILQLTPTMRLTNTYNILKAIARAEAPSEVMTAEKIFAYDREQLERALSGDIYGKNFCRYILLKLEYIWKESTEVFGEFNRISVEHVLPQKPAEDSQWRQDFTEEERGYWLHKLGNLVLLSRIKNSRLNNRDFAQKKQKYFASSINAFPNVNKVMQLDEWTPKIVEERQSEQLAKLMNEFK